MEKESITCFQYKLRNLACDGEILKLLKALHERCGASGSTAFIRITKFTRILRNSVKRFSIRSGGNAEW